MYHSQPNGGAYAKIDQALVSPKRAEAHAISGLTRRMIAAFASEGTPFPRKVELLHENRRLWQAVMLSVANDENELPDGLRAGLLSLGAFVERATTELLAGKGDIRVLVEINRRIVGGLSTDPA